MVEVDDSLFGCDYSSNGEVSANGDILTVEGIKNAEQSITNQILTQKGFYPSIDDEYGSEIFEVLGEDYEDYNIDAIIVHIQNALLENPRVLEINRIEPYVTIDKKLKFIIETVLVNGTSDSLNIDLEE